MNKKIILTAIISLFLAAVTISAQTVKPNFSGVWELDTGKSVLPETMRVQAMTIRVAQTEKQFTIPEISIRASSENGARRPQASGFFGGGDNNNAYNLDGTETNSEIDNQMTKGRILRQATFTSDGKLNLTSTSKVSNEFGDFTIQTRDIWESLDDKTLKITRYMETPRGATTAEMYFNKTAADVYTVKGNSVTRTSTDSGNAPKAISGGVLNGKATNLSVPAYPAAARAVKAGGAVNVQVTIDEQGNVISAAAVSGHPLLRSAAEEAARNSKFAPTLLEGNPVKVSGIIVYNFAP